MVSFNLNLMVNLSHQLFYNFYIDNAFCCEAHVLLLDYCGFTSQAQSPVNY